MLYIQHYIKTVSFYFRLKYNGLAIVRKITKLIEGGHRGLQDYRHICYYFYVFYFFQNPKSRDFLCFFLPCFVRFLYYACDINVIYTSLKSTFNGLQYGSIFMRLAIVDSKYAKSREIPREFELRHIAVQGYPRHRSSWCQSKAHTTSD